MRRSVLLLLAALPLALATPTANAQSAANTQEPVANAQSTANAQEPTASAQTPDTLATNAQALAQAQYLKSVLKYDEAIALLKGNPSREALEAIGDCYLQSGDYLDAISSYHQLARAYPEELFYQVRLMVSIYRAQDYKLCIKCGQAIIQRDSIPAVLTTIGDSFNKLGQKDSALVYYKHALRLKPLSESIVNKAGKLLLDTKDYDGAIAITDSLLAVDPANQVAGSIKGVASYMKKDYETSCTIFEDQVNNGRDDYAGYFYLGMSEMNLKDHILAVRDLKEAFRCDSTKAELALTIAYELSRLFDEDADKEAKVWLEKALKLLEPDHETTSRAYMQYARLYRAEKDYTKVAECCRKALEHTPDDPDILYTLAYAYDHLKDYKNAILYYERCIEKSPTSPTGAAAAMNLKMMKAEQFMQR